MNNKEEMKEKRINLFKIVKELLSKKCILCLKRRIKMKRERMGNLILSFMTIKLMSLCFAWDVRMVQWR